MSRSTRNDEGPRWAERFNRTLKAQAIHGRIFRNVEEVRAAVTEFKDRYNRHWRPEKLGTSALG